MSGRLTGKVAVITGGAHGIGRATVARFVAEGARVMVADIDAEAAADSAAAANRGRAHGDGQARPGFLDAGDEKSWRELLAATQAEFGGLQVVVNNAASRTPLTLEATSMEDWQANQRVTAGGVFLGTKLAGECIVGRGSVVNVASIAAFVGLPASFPYSAAKGAVRALSRSAALHFAAQGRDIRVNVVAPGATLTEAVRRQAGLLAAREGVTADEMLRRLAAETPLRRMAEPREIAEAILFLASDEASFITGAELLVDGGLTAQ